MKKKNLFFLVILISFYGCQSLPSNQTAEKDLNEILNGLYTIDEFQKTDGRENSENKTYQLFYSARLTCIDNNINIMTAGSIAQKIGLRYTDLFLRKGDSKTIDGYLTYRKYESGWKAD